MAVGRVGGVAVGVLVAVGGGVSVTVAVVVAVGVADHSDVEVAVGVAVGCSPGVAEMGPYQSLWPFTSIHSSL